MKDPSYNIVSARGGLGLQTSPGNFPMTSYPTGQAREKS